jgi:gluconokinase
VTAAVPAEIMIGLDVGTTGAKAVAFGIESGWRHVALREYPLLQPAPGQEVQDPAVVLAAVGDALAECVASLGSARVRGVSVSSGMHGLMALDAEMRPLTPLITWADSRAHEEARALRDSGQDAALHALTGVPVHPMTPLTKLIWFGHHDPQTLAAARWWVGLKDYILLWLTGGLVTELSSASGTGLLDLASRSWSAVALGLTEISAEQLPPIAATTAMLPLSAAVAARVGLPADTPVIAGAGDGPLGNLGTGAMRPGVAGLNLGTSGALRMAVEAPYVDDERTLFCYALTEAVWIIGGAISNGGVVMRWAEDALVPEAKTVGSSGADAAVLELAARIPAGCDGLMMLPYLLAERAPLWNPDIPGAIVGLRRAHTREHMVRAALEGVCLQMRLVLDRLDDVDRVDSVRVTGGVFRATLWREVMAAMLARPLHVVGDAEGTALGAAALGLFALGDAPALADAASQMAGPETAPAAVVEPDHDLVARYDLMRASLPDLVAGLGEVAALCLPTATPSAPVR